MKEARVYQNSAGYWVVEDAATGIKIGDVKITELEAYKLANFYGYIVR